MKPLIIINFKNYEESTGKDGLKLAAYSSAYNNIIVCPQFMEIDNISQLTTVFSQHVDPITSGPYTGKISINSIKKAGAKGSLLNHSENRIPFIQIKETVNLLKKNNMKSIVCCETLNECVKIAKLKPDYVAYEPKKLIGKNIDLAELKGKEIIKIKKLIKPVKLIVGAGVDSPMEIRKLLSLGAVGVLIASSVVKNKNPRKIIRELANA